MPLRRLSSDPTSVSFKQLQQSAVGVYLELLKHAKKWPLEEGREERSLKHPLIKRIEQELKTIERSDDQKEILKLGQKGQKDLEAMFALLRNQSFRKYKLEEYRVPSVVNQEKKLLATKTQIKVKRRKWGQIDRFLSWYLSEPVKTTETNKADEINKNFK